MIGIGRARTPIQPWTSERVPSVDPTCLAGAELPGPRSTTIKATAAQTPWGSRATGRVITDDRHGCPRSDNVGRVFTPSIDRGLNGALGLHLGESSEHRDQCHLAFSDSERGSHILEVPCVNMV